MDPRPIYLDFNATTPVDPAVAEAMLPYLYEHFGNPSSPHALGRASRRAVESARAQVALLIGCRPAEVIFTSGGSEASNMVIKGVAAAMRARGDTIVVSAVEHPAVMEPCRALEREGIRITIVPVDGEGRVDPRDVAKALTPATILVSIMHANNEVGTIQPIAEIAALARERGVLVHTDAAQSVGKIPVDVRALGVDFLSLAGHKLHAPKGIGALYVREGREIPSLIHGAGHEGGRRAGTENVLEIVGLGLACELAAGRLGAAASHCRALRERLWEGLSASGADLRRNGSRTECLPNTLSVGFRGVDAATLLAEIGDQVAASPGAACHGAETTISPVLLAMEVPPEYAAGTVRFSVGRTTTEAEIDAAAGIVVGAVRRLGAPAAGAGTAAGREGIRLTRFTRGMGCACKLRSADLERVLRALPAPRDARVLVGIATSDDAAVYALRDDLAIVQTVDFFTPIVDDPFDFGAISAANSLSDIYAMGAEPLFALNIVGFPVGRLPLEVLERILEGAAEVAEEAGISLVGGHSIDDPEPKFGLAVTGTVHPGRIVTNAGARPGDTLILTKPLGTGIVATALKQGAAPRALEERARSLMRRLNASASRAMVDHGATACTDVTGYGLLGHLREMAAGARVNVVLDSAAVPVLEGVEDLAAAGHAPGGSRANLEHAARWIDGRSRLSATRRLILADAQTSGGLLVAVPGNRAAGLLEAIHRGGDPEAAIIGRFTDPGPGRIEI